MRFSSENQRDESIDAQQRAINEYAQKHGYLIINEYVDRAKSAKSGDRPQFLQMIDDSKKGEFSVVLVDKLDRFSRNRFDSSFNKQILKNNGVTVVSVKENLDGSPESVIMESVLEGFAEYYSLNLARETMKGLKENAYKAMATGGKPPYGFKVNPETKLYEINEDEAQAVRYMFQWITEGRGYSFISEELYKMGYKSRTGKPISPSTMTDMLCNRKYVGDFIYNKSAPKDSRGKRNGHAYKDESEWIVVEGGCPQIVSHEIFDEVQRIKAENKGKFINQNHKKQYLLSGKVYCGHCGERWHGESRYDKKQGIDYILYVCSAKKKRKDLKCQSKAIHRDRLEQTIIKVLANEIFCDAMVERIIGYYNQYLIGSEQELQEYIKMLKNRLKGNETALEGVLEAITKVRSEALFGKLTRLEEEKKELEAQIKDAQLKANSHKVDEADIRAGFSHAKTLLRNSALSNTKELIAKFVDRVEIFDEGIFVKLNFSKFRRTPPPNPYKDLPIKEQVMIAQGLVKCHEKPHENFTSNFIEKNTAEEDIPSPSAENMLTFCELSKNKENFHNIMEINTISTIPLQPQTTQAEQKTLENPQNHKKMPEINELTSNTIGGKRGRVNLQRQITTGHGTAISLLSLKNPSPKDFFTGFVPSGSNPSPKSTKTQKFEADITSTSNTVGGKRGIRTLGGV